jgi:hypothetical protein
VSAINEQISSGLIELVTAHATNSKKLKGLERAAILVRGLNISQVQPYGNVMLRRRFTANDPEPE